VLVIHDLLGLLGDFRPKFVKQYRNLTEDIGKAVKEYIDEVASGSFPDDSQSFH
jgi:3-methyl-2-oxobutanoate hydroxymethyltransferase